jgi:hypothetical protein
MNKNPDVDDWLAAYDNPQKELVRQVRDVILKSDGRITECIKWKAPTFVYKGNIASFFPRAMGHVSLMFHNGVKISGDFPDLEGDGPAGRSFKIASVTDLESKAEQLSQIFRTWCDIMDS